MLEWECCLKHPQDGAREGAAFIREPMLRKNERTIDDFASVAGDPDLNRVVLGLAN